MVISEDGETSHFNGKSPQKPQKEACGQTNITVDREELSSLNSQVKTGLVMGCCRHLHVLDAANTNKGKFYRIVHHIKLKMWKQG